MAERTGEYSPFPPSTIKTVESAANSTYSPFFDIRKSRDFYHQLTKTHGIARARNIALPVLQQDLYTQAWEAVDGKKPYEYKYRIITDSGTQKLVHESDLHNGKDISDGLNPTIRRGRERLGILNLRQAIMDAQVGETVVQASPKKHATKESQKDCYYPDTFFTLAQVLENPDGSKYAKVRQFKNRFITAEMAADVVNLLVKAKAISNREDLDSVIETASTYAGTITDEEIVGVMEQVSGVKMEDGQEIQFIKDRAKFAGKRLMAALDLNLTDEQLRQVHTELLINILGDATSSKIIRGPGGVIQIRSNCGTLTSGSSIRSSMLGSALFTGEGESEGWHDGVCVKCNKEKWVGGCDICKDCESSS